MINKPIEELELLDLQSLVTNGVRESKSIEYKEELPKGNDASIKEFLADITSFANTNSGDLIFGIAETGGIATDLVNIESNDIDAEILKYENIIRDGTEPRANVHFKAVSVENNKYILLARIYKSTARPHRVTFKGHDKFYGRNSAGKFSLDTNELRIAFTQSDELVLKIKNFQIDRIMNLSTNNTPVNIRKSAKLCIHLIPVETFGQDNFFSVEQLQPQITNMKPIYSLGWNNMINIDGIVTYSNIEEDLHSGYVQLYKSGIIEAVDTSMLVADVDDVRFIPSVAYEDKLMKAYNSYLKIYTALDVKAPVLLFVSFIDIRGYRLGVGNTGNFNRSTVYNNDNLLLPGVYIDSIDKEADQIFRTIFDVIWNAFGYAKSHNYDETGKWVRR